MNSFEWITIALLLMTLLVTLPGAVFYMRLLVEGRRRLDGSFNEN